MTAAPVQPGDLSRAKATSKAMKSPSRAAKNDPRATPAMRQYFEFKARHPECVLFFRMGDFYEMFDEDAVLCHKVLGITLTERTKGVAMAGVPYHAVEGYLRRMIEQGYRVAVCEQVQDPKEAKGVVDRAVTRVLTPGTLVDETLLDDARPNLVGAIQFTEAGDGSPAVLALAELSTGSFTLHDLPADRVLDEVERFGPSELLFVETADGNPPARIDRLAERLHCAITPRPAWTFRATDARDLLLDHFGVATLSGFGLTDDDDAIGPAGAIVRYLQETQAGLIDNANSGDARRLAHVRPPRREAAESYVIIDATSLRSLEIERTMRTGETTGSLLGTLQRCRTPMGKRLLRQWLCFPLRDVTSIERRQRAVGALVEDRDFAERLSDTVSRVQDVARMVGRVSLGRATPRDAVAMGRSIQQLGEVLDLLDQRPAFADIFNRLSTLADSLGPLGERIRHSCVDDPPAHLREGGLFRDGVDAQLDEARTLQRDGNTYLARYQKDLIESTGIASLKVGYNKVFGYYIELSRANASKAPVEFTRKQTLKNAERYITPQLKEFEEKITTAASNAIEREQRLFDELCQSIGEHVAALAEYADLVARLDVLACFAENAWRFGYVRPDVVEEPVLEIDQGRHPVLDQLMSDRFVPNDTVLGTRPANGSGSDEADAADLSNPTEVTTLALITGPNMAGKSTYIRQTALITLLAHTGSFVPAHRARVGIVDRIFTRIGANDELHAGQSTFMVEMTETANILHHATPRSLVILDEIGRGTSTLDGLSLAWAIAETLADIGCRSLFATHYHELTALADNMTNVSNLHVAVRELGAPGDEEVVFLYRIFPGRADRSYGIHVARIAGIPTETIRRAREILDTLVVHTGQAEVEIEKRVENSAQHGRQLSLFTEYIHHPAIDELRQVKLETITPLQAFEMLKQLKESVTDED